MVLRWRPWAARLIKSGEPRDCFFQGMGRCRAVPRREPAMTRSTRAAAAVARLNRRAEGRFFQMVVTGSGLFRLREQIEGEFCELGEPLAQDEFICFVDAQGPQVTRRISKFDEAFARQLVKKD